VWHDDGAGAQHREDQVDDDTRPVVDPTSSSPSADDRPGPAGEVYDWYLRALELMDSGDNAAAVQLLERAVRAEPSARSLREALARAQFDARMFAGAEATFAHLVSLDPTDHYAQFGLGLSLSRQGRAEAALEPLALAVAMRPDLKHYGDALRQARATARSRRATDPTDAPNAAEG
jgi:tetratricopeptide (TPR) repeat protein